MTRAGVVAGLLLAAGLVLAALPGFLLLMGDCWASSNTPEATRLCEIEKRREVFAFLALAPALWLAGVALAIRRRSFAVPLGLVSGPLAYGAARLLF